MTQRIWFLEREDGYLLDTHFYAANVAESIAEYRTSNSAHSWKAVEFVRVPGDKGDTAK